MELSSIQNEEFLYDDVVKFYELISDCISKKLSMTENDIHLSYSNWKSNRSNSSILCKIDTDRYVCFKKYDDDVSNSMRQDLITLQLKQKVGFPHYTIIKSSNLFLRRKASQKNHEFFNGWEQKDFLIIDFGNYEDTNNLLDVPFDKIKDLESFCNHYGMWSAFNYLFGIHDRNAENFVYSHDTGIVHSVDCEYGPFDWKGRNVGVLDIIYETRKAFDRFINHFANFPCRKFLHDGFVHGWYLIEKNADKIDILNNDELVLFKKRLTDDPEQIARIFFEYAGMWNKL